MSSRYGVPRWSFEYDRLEAQRRCEVRSAAADAFVREHADEVAAALWLVQAKRVAARAKRRAQARLRTRAYRGRMPVDARRARWRDEQDRRRSDPATVERINARRRAVYAEGR